MALVMFPIGLGCGVLTEPSLFEGMSPPLCRKFLPPLHAERPIKFLLIDACTHIRTLLPQLLLGEALTLEAVLEAGGY